MPQDPAGRVTYLPLPTAGYEPAPRSPALLLLALAALAPAGCGLADYEKKMQEAEARLQRFDEENRVLGDPLVFPSQGPTVDVFLRPPKGISKDQSTQKDDVPFHYPATADGVCTDMYVVFGGGEDSKEKLEQAVQQAWLGAETPWRPHPVQPNGRPEMTFDSAEFADPRAPANAPAVFVVFVHQDAGHAPVAVLFRVLQVKRAGADAALQMSLESYAEAGLALAAKAQYTQWRKP